MMFKTLDPMRLCDVFGGHKASSFAKLEGTKHHKQWKGNAIAPGDFGASPSSFIPIIGD